MGARRRDPGCRRRPPASRARAATNGGCYVTRACVAGQACPPRRRELQGPARRTLVVRLGLVAGVVALLAAAVMLSGDLRAYRPATSPRAAAGRRARPLVERRASRSTQRAHRVLRSLAETEGRVGLVVFSDVAYEMLPPARGATSCGRCSASSSCRRKGSPRPAIEIGKASRALVRHRQPVVAHLPRRHPHLPGSRGGTAVIGRDGIRPDVMLISDLDDSASTPDQLTQELIRVRGRRHRSARRAAVRDRGGSRPLRAARRRGGVRAEPGAPGNTSIEGGRRSSARSLPPWPPRRRLLLALLAVNERACGRARVEERVSRRACSDRSRCWRASPSRSCAARRRRRARARGGRRATTRFATAAARSRHGLADTALPAGIAKGPARLADDLAFRSGRAALASPPTRAGDAVLAADRAQRRRARSPGLIGGRRSAPVRARNLRGALLRRGGAHSPVQRFLFVRRAIEQLPRAPSSSTRRTGTPYLNLELVVAAPLARPAELGRQRRAGGDAGLGRRLRVGGSGYLGAIVGVTFLTPWAAAVGLVLAAVLVLLARVGAPAGSA